MVRFKSGATVPFALSWTGRRLSSTLTSLNSPGFSTLNTPGSSVTSVLAGVALVGSAQDPEMTTSKRMAINAAAGGLVLFVLFKESPHVPRLAHKGKRPIEDGL